MNSKPYELVPVAATYEAVTEALKWAGLPIKDSMAVAGLVSVKDLGHSFYRFIPQAGCDRHPCLVCTKGTLDYAETQQLYLEVYTETGYNYRFNAIWLAV